LFDKNQIDKKGLRNYNFNQKIMIVILILFFHSSLKGAVKITSIVDSVDGSGTSIALRSDGTPTIAYHYATNSYLRYAEYNGTSFSVYSITDNCSGAVSHAIDNNDISYISFIPSLTYGLYCASGTPSIGWSFTYLDSLTPVNETSIAINPTNGYPAIAYHDSSISQQLKYVYYDGISWIINTVDNYSISGSSVLGCVSLTFSDAGVAHISYYVDYGTYNALKHAWDVGGGSWDREIVESNIYIDNTSIKMDNDGSIHIAYTDTTPSAQIKYAKKVGGLWEYQLIEESESSFVSITLNSKNYPLLAYGYYNSGSSYYELCHAFWNGVSWGKVHLESSSFDRGYGTSIEIDQNGVLHIASRDGSGYVYHTRYYDDAMEPNDDFGSSWEIPIDTTVYAFIWSSVDVDYYKFYTTRIGTVTINLSSLPFNYELYLYDINYSTLAVSTNSGSISESINQYLSTPSTYYIRIIGYNGIYSSTDTYTLSLSFSIGNTNPSLEWANFTGYGDENDGIEPDEGVSTTTFSYKITYKDSDNDPPYTGYPILHIYKGGVEISSETMSFHSWVGSTGDYTQGAVYVYNVTNMSTGTDYGYYFEAVDYYGAYATTTFKSGPMVLSTSTEKTEDPYYELNDDFSSAYLISVDTTIYAYIWDSNDVDYYKFYTIIEGTVTINLTSLPFDYELYLFDVNFSTLDYSNSGGASDEQIQRYLSVPSTYYIKVFGFNSAYSSTDTYSLSVSFSSKTILKEPVLEWVGTGVYTSRGVDYLIGSNTMTYTFKVKYKNPEGSSPSYVDLYLERDGYFYNSYTMNFESGDYSTGAIFYYSINLYDTGSYRYYFKSEDINGNVATGTPTVYQTGPTIYYSNLSFYGYVIDGNTNNGIGNIEVKLFKNGVEISNYYTLSDGYYDFSLEFIPSGYYEIKCYEPVYDFYPEYYRITTSSFSSSSVQKDFTGYRSVSDAFILSGYVYTPDYLVISDIEVRAVDEYGTVYSTRTDVNGFYRLILPAYYSYEIKPVPDVPYYDFYPYHYYADRDVNFDFTSQWINYPEPGGTNISNNIIRKGSGENMIIRVNTGGWAGDVKIKVYNLAGKIVKEWTEFVDSSRTSIYWDGKGEYEKYLPHGVYYIVIEGEGIKQRTIPVIIRGK